jgi:hypothetical protein
MKKHSPEPRIVLFTGEGVEHRLTLSLDTNPHTDTGTLIDERGQIFDASKLEGDVKARIVSNIPVSISAALGLPYPHKQIVGTNFKQ